MISGLCWNARGIYNKGTICYLKSLISKHDFSFCVILKPKVQVNKISSTAKKLGFNYYKHGSPDNTHI